MTTVGHWWSLSQVLETYIRHKEYRPDACNGKPNCTKLHHVCRVHGFNMSQCVSTFRRVGVLQSLPCLFAFHLILSAFISFHHCPQKQVSFLKSHGCSKTLPSNCHVEKPRIVMNSLQWVTMGHHGSPWVTMGLNSQESVIPGVNIELISSLKSASSRSALIMMKDDESTGRELSRRRLESLLSKFVPCQR